MAAIKLDNQYYSFFRAEREQSRALTVYQKLSHRGHTAIITRIPKGYAIWVFEPDAQPAKPTAQSFDDTTSAKPTYRLLISPSQYYPCSIQVPDLEQPLTAIQFENRYYSLFKTIGEIQQAVQLIKRLRYRGDETLITKTDDGYSLWILEPDATIL